MDLSAQERNWPASNQALQLGQNRAFKSYIMQGRGGRVGLNMVDRAGQGRPAWKGAGQAHATGQDSQQVQGCSAGLRPSSRSKKLWTWLRRKKLHFFYKPPQKFNKSSIMDVSNKPQQCHQNLWSCHQGKIRFLLHHVTLYTVLKYSCALHNLKLL